MLGTNHCLKFKFKHCTKQCIYDQHTEASVATVQVQDQPRVSNLISSPLANAQTCRDDRMLPRIRHEEKIVEQNGVLNIDHEIDNKPNKVYKSSKDCATNTVPGNKPPNNVKQSAAKHLTPCPFL